MIEENEHGSVVFHDGKHEKRPEHMEKLKIIFHDRVNGHWVGNE